MACTGIGGQRRVIAWFARINRQSSPWRDGRYFRINGIKQQFDPAAGDARSLKSGMLAFALRAILRPCRRGDRRGHATGARYGANSFAARSYLSWSTERGRRSANAQPITRSGHRRQGAGFGWKPPTKTED